MVYEIYSAKRNFFSGFSVTLYLIAVNVVAFFVFALLIGINQGLLDYIAIRPSNILQGKYLWTFFTSMFMHGGLFHIFANMFSLLFVGSLVEKILGGKRYLYFYLTSGLFAGLLFVLLSLLFVSDSQTYAVGASGALFGLVGLLVLLTPNLPVYIMFIPIPIKMKYAGPGILVSLWLISSIANIGIGNTAHLGGLIAGIAYGLYLKNKFPRKTKMIQKYFK
tara:strand:- start:735 stop:1397 length:663 start_codon:yes stop_codon:yes gene_type:complete